MSESWKAYNDFMMHGELERFTKIFARFEIYREILSVPGDIVECGVMKGTGLFLWARLLEIFAPYSKQRVIGFDTFEGYPQDAPQAHDRTAARDFRKEQIQSTEEISLDSLTRVASNLGLSHRIELVKGNALDTIPQYVAQNPGFRISLLDLDFVLYEPTRVALEYLEPKVVPGGAVVLDEYALAGMGESDAVDEYFENRMFKPVQFPWAASPTAYWIKQPKQG